MYCCSKLGVVVSAIHLQKVHPELNFTTGATDQQDPSDRTVQVNLRSPRSFTTTMGSTFFSTRSVPRSYCYGIASSLDLDFNTQSDLQGYLHAADGNPCWTRCSPAKSQELGDKKSLQHGRHARVYQKVDRQVGVSTLFQVDVNKLFRKS